jgi:hypothetical protein
MTPRIHDVVVGGQDQNAMPVSTSSSTVSSSTTTSSSMPLSQSFQSEESRTSTVPSVPLSSGRTIRKVRWQDEHDALALVPASVSQDAQIKSDRKGKGFMNVPTATRMFPFGGSWNRGGSDNGQHSGLNMTPSEHSDGRMLATSVLKESASVQHFNGSGFDVVDGAFLVSVQHDIPSPSMTITTERLNQRLSSPSSSSAPEPSTYTSSSTYRPFHASLPLSRAMSSESHASSTLSLSSLATSTTSTTSSFSHSQTESQAQSQPPKHSLPGGRITYLIPVVLAAPILIAMMLLSANKDASAKLDVAYLGMGLLVIVLGAMLVSFHSFNHHLSTLSSVLKLLLHAEDIRKKLTLCFYWGLDYV